LNSVHEAAREWCMLVEMAVTLSHQIDVMTLQRIHIVVVAFDSTDRPWYQL